MNFVMWFGNTTILLMSGMLGIDPSLYEAAVIDGANRRQYLFKVAIPMLGPIFKTACTMSMIGSLKYFDMIWNMTQGGPAGGTELMATYMYKLSFQQWKMGYGSAVAAGMFILITVIALLFQKVFVVKEGKERTQGVAYLDDGTMIVVEDGIRSIGKEISVTVTSVLQTAAGRMIFGRKD